MLSKRRITVVQLLVVLTVLCSHSASAAPVSWSINSDGLWQAPANWSSSPNLPGSADDVTIDRPGTITVTLSSGNQNIRSLLDQENLVVGGGTSLTLAVGAGGAQLNGALTISPGATMRSYSGGTIQANGTVIADSANLTADSGGKMIWPTLTSYFYGNNITTVQASGTGSKIDFSHITSLSGGNRGAVGLNALSGGLVDASAIASITTGATDVYASGSGSVVDLTSLTTFGGDNPFQPRRLRVDTGGKIISPNLTTLVASGIGLNISISGATSSIDLSHVTSFNSVSISVDSGGVFTPPTAITSYSYGNDAPLIQASGTGSKIDFSHITSLSGGNRGAVGLNALSGGLVDASAIASITTGATDVYASGSGSVVDLTSLTTFGGDNPFQPRRLRVDTGGKIISPNLTTLVASGIGLNISISGATSSIDLSHVTSFNSVSISVDSGGVFTPPTAITSYSYGSDVTTIQAAGAASKIDFSHVTSFSGGNSGSSHLYATSGGLVDASAIASITTGATDVYASGNGSVVDLTSLTTFGGTNSFQTRRIHADSGGTVRLRTSGTTAVSNAAADLDPTGTITGDTLELDAGGILSGNGVLHANLVNSAGAIRPGTPLGSQETTGNFSQSGSGSLELDIGGLTPVTTFDQLLVDGNASLGGVLKVSLVNSLVPIFGQSFQILTAVGNVSGTFNALQLATLTGGLQWQVSYGAHSVTLTVVNFYGDYNGDGVVDAADYPLWRRSLGSAGLNLAADGDHNDVVNQADYNFWRARFGQTSASGSATVLDANNIAVPEPSAIGIFVLAIPCMASRMRSRKR